MDKLFVLENEAKKSLFQWDLNQRFIVNDPLIIQAHYYVSAKEAPLSCEVFEENGLFLVEIPNILLQKAGNYRVYAYHQDSTIDVMQFEVKPRPKPANYIYEETELVTINSLVAAALEDAKASGAFKGDAGPIGPAGKNGLDGKDGQPGKDGKDGKDGTDYILTEQDRKEIANTVKSDLEYILGDINTALDRILEIQDELIGGGK